VALKARLLDQSRLAGVGNLIADEVLWRAGLAPARPANSLTANELRRLHRHVATGLADLIRRGGSHLGDLQPERRPGGHCPRDHAELSRGVVGGRTTWWCPRHQH
jgi:formamidopyrimidine-DNA glycosylase